MLVLIGLIVYTFRDMIGPVTEQMRKTSPMVIVGLCVMTVVYHLMEGSITTLLAKQFNPAFTYGKGVINAFYCSFYRTATLGSGAGVAAVINLGENGVEHSIGFGLYMIQYAFHRLSIAVFSAVFFVLNWTYMCGYYESYMGILIVGYVLTLILTVLMILLCCSKKFHRVLFRFLDWLDLKLNRKFDVQIASLRGECRMLERASRKIMKKKGLLFAILVISLVRNVFWFAMPYLVYVGKTDITLSQSLAITSLIITLSAVIPMPGGVGSTELLFTSLYSAMIDTGLAGSAALLYRFGTFIVPFLIGAVVVIARKVRRPKQT